MSLNFDERIDRTQTNSVKWHQYGRDVIPMWVADMDFRSPEPVVRVLCERVEHGTFGYEWPSDGLCKAICGWLDRKYGWKVKTEDIVYLPGLVSGLNQVTRAFGHIGDEAMMTTPVYPPFLGAPQNQGLAAVKVPLRRIEMGQTLHYELDAEAIERATPPRASLFIHCHPHNPIGREWSPEENRRLAEVCAKHNLVICSDEIHSDLTLSGVKHMPMAALSPEIADRCVTLMAPSKTFNLPGFGMSVAIIQNPVLRKRFEQAGMGLIPHVNALGLVAAETAYTECDDWLAELLAYLTANRDALTSYLAEHMPMIKFTIPEATYLGWLDCRALKLDGSAYRFFLQEAKVALSDGANFGPGGEGHVRINFGCPRAQLLEALERMCDAVKRLDRASPQDFESDDRAA